MIIFSTLILSMYITIALIPPFNKLAYRINVLDFPDDRKVHSIPKSRIGGIAMALSIFPPLFFWASMSPMMKSLFISSGIIVTFGVIDDFKGLDFRVKFVGQILAALVVILYGGIQIVTWGNLLPEGFVIPKVFSIALTVIVIIGVTNAINLSDGLDGLAGGVTLLSFVCIGYLAHCFENDTILLFSVAVIGSIFGFLRYNSYPAVLFMGDTGSQLLGFLAISLILALTQNSSPLSPLLPLLIMGFPILDTLSVMLSRIFSGESPFKPDKRHFHHRLISLGLYHSEAVLTIYFLQSFFVISAFLFRFSSEWFLLTFYLVFSGVILLFFLITSTSGWKLSRQKKFDTIFKDRLRPIKERYPLIQIAFGIVRFLLPALLIFSCFTPQSVPLYLSILSLIILAVFIITWKINVSWLFPFSSFIFYLSVPLLIYLGETNTAFWATPLIMKLNAILFSALLVFEYLTLKFTRRKGGFKSTPLDFLILFAVLVIPNLPDESIQNLNLGSSAIKVIVLYLGFEVFTGELRGKSNQVWLLVGVVLSILGVRGFFI